MFSIFSNCLFFNAAGTCGADHTNWKHLHIVVLFSSHPTSLPHTNRTSSSVIRCVLLECTLKVVVNAYLDVFMYYTGFLSNKTQMLIFWRFYQEFHAFLSHKSATFPLFLNKFSQNKCKIMHVFTNYCWR